MIIDAIKRIEQIDTIEKVALSYHVPSNGIYIIVDQNFNYKVISKDGFSFNTKYVVMDFYSQIIEPNKAIDKHKLITSNNYYTFFCKHIDKLTPEIIDNYYNALETPKECLIYKDWIKENLSNIYNRIDIKDSIKVFFVTDIKNYIDAKNKYLDKYVLSNVVKLNNVDYGTPLTVNLNAKKPFLKNFSKKVKVPYLVNKNEAIKDMYFNRILMSFAKKGKELLYILENGELIPISYRAGEMIKRDFTNGLIFVYRINERGKIDILDMDTVPIYTRNL